MDFEAHGKIASRAYNHNQWLPPRSPPGGYFDPTLRAAAGCTFHSHAGPYRMKWGKMRINVSTDEISIVNGFMLPIQNTSQRLSEGEDAKNAIEWGEIKVARGAIDSKFMIEGALMVGGWFAGLASNLLASYLWEKIQKHNKLQIEIVVDVKGTPTAFPLASESLEALTVSVKKAAEATLSAHSKGKISGAA
jgi:hypothetical protein